MADTASAKRPEEDPEGTGAASDAAPAPAQTAEVIDDEERERRRANRAAKRKAKREAAVAEALAAQPPIVEVAPIAAPAKMRRRHWGVLFSFLLFVIGPIAAASWYLITLAEDQFASKVGFTIRQEETGSASDVLGGVAASFGGGSSQKDADILYEFMQSQDMVVRVSERIDLLGHYSTHWDTDPVFSIWPEASIEDLTWFWGRILQVAYDSNTGLIEVRLLAFDPDVAHDLAEVVLDESQRLINDLNAQARTDTMRYAQEDLDEAIVRLKDAREALTLFRTRTQIVDPATDLAGRMGVVNTLQQQLAAALIDRDLLAERTNASDPRVTQAERRIEVIRARIAEERQNFASGQETLEGDSYPSLLAEYEGLIVDREFAEQTYRASLAALDAARANADRQSRYLAAYISPTLPQRSEYPRAWVIIGLTALFSFLAWSILALVYYSIRDSR